MSQTMSTSSIVYEKPVAATEVLNNACVKPAQKPEIKVLSEKPSVPSSMKQTLSALAMTGNAPLVPLLDFSKLKWRWWILLNYWFNA